MQIPDSVSMNDPDSVSIPYPGSVLESHPGQSPWFFPSIQSLDFPSRNAVASRKFVGQFRSLQGALYVPQSFRRHVLPSVQNDLRQSAHWILRLCLILSVCLSAFQSGQPARGQPGAHASVPEPAKPEAISHSRKTGWQQAPTAVCRP